MIERVYIKDLVSFDEVSLELKGGLIVFTGPSGAGKSLLMQSILATLGYGLPQAKLCEIEIDANIESDEYILSNPIVIKAIKKSKSRYYIDGQNISQKKLKELLNANIKYLSVRDKTHLNSSDIIDTIDRYISQQNIEYKKLLATYKTLYKQYKRELNKLLKKQDEAKQIDELIEFARFEIEKISSINPKPNEYEELMSIKQKLSKIDRVKEAIEKAVAIFEYEQSVSEVYSLIGKDEQFFVDAMNQLRVDFESFEDMAMELEDIDIEYVLDRLEKLHSLIRRYDSIENAIEYMHKKEQELQEYMNIENDLTNLEEIVSTKKDELLNLAKSISDIRKEYIPNIEASVSDRLLELKLPAISIVSNNIDEPTLDGIDIFELKMGNLKISTLSGGEFNRLRLALMSLVPPKSGVKEIIFLDEIDANVSGDESIAIAKMITDLAKDRQIFAISHQPHLSSQANMHILVQKSQGKSYATILQTNDRIKEVARIIAGEKADSEAKAFAQKLIGKYSNSKLFRVNNNTHRSVI